MAIRWTWIFLLHLGFSAAWMDQRPVLESHDGNLVISSAQNRNITLKILGDGFLNVNDINLLHVASTAQNAARLIEGWRRGYLDQVEQDISRLSKIIEGPHGLQRRVNVLEYGGELNITTSRPSSSKNSGTSDTGARNSIRRLTDRVKRLEDKVRNVVNTLRQNECQSNPCSNGGSCLDLYDGYQCHCPSNWEGPTCNTDVNECARLVGTDLGCQNGATCVNLVGSYQCNCAPGWFGLHCTKKTPICNTENSEELCGHGVCVSKQGSVIGYTCICDQGWESDGTNPACTKDVDECAAKHPPCSVSPAVPCINVPGTFYCGGCPHGYTGNGYYCIDVDECLTENGGCSTQPRVPCINTMGSRVCGSCPPGYEGDGTSCSYVGACRVNNGGCHPLATCTENLGMSNGYVLCRCPSGFVGDGMGPHGCQPDSTSQSGSCANNPCVHGVCRAQGTQSFVCICDAGYTGTLCNNRVDPCSQNPCQNGGTCVVRGGEVLCDCPSSYKGSRCETPRQSCGGVLRNPIGTLAFPGTGTTYQHGLSCAWVIMTNHSMVLNVTFSAFNVEPSTDCKYDFLQIHDGRNTGSHAIGRFCGNELPNKGNIISSHNTLYFWFHSDSSLAHEGFTFHWDSIEPVCGGELTDNFGTIVSPGYPGNYPPNRDCEWAIFIKPSKRLQFHFGQLMLEEHPTCQNDYVEILDLDEKQLGLYCNHSRPEPLLIHGPVALLRFHSDSAGQDAGFQIHYTSVEGLPGCGGTFTAPSGIISSPGDASSYLPSLECEWKIQIPIGERIKITWLSFEVENSRSCRFDFVKIYDGGDIDSPSFGKFCGSDLPPTIKSTSNMLLVVFETDWSFEMAGFRLKYEAICDKQFTESSGIIESPNYPNLYPADKVCGYEIVQPVGKGIALTMLDMDIESKFRVECDFDHLRIYDGDSSNSTRLADLCGDNDEMPHETFYSSGNYMYLEFTSDSTVRGNGWRANYTTLDRHCGGMFKAPTGVIEPPTEGGLYAGNEDCTWVIKAPPGHVVQLTWNQFQLEHHPRCTSDYVSVYDGYQTSGSHGLLGRYCGTTLPPMMTSQGMMMTVVFHTDSSVQYDGFSASYSFADTSNVCGGHYFTLNGVLRSPNYPDEYPEMRRCVWVIEAPNKQKVMLRVEKFNLENSSSCFFDYLEIRNGGYETSPLIGKYCGTNIPQLITSYTHQMYVKFVSDSTRSGPGFSIDWYNGIEGCGGILNSATGDIMSPNYPQPYTQNSECTWNIVVAAGSKIRMFVMDMDLEQHVRCRFDYIEIIDGTGRQERSRSRYCGQSTPTSIDTTSNTATVRFRSDFTTNARGFHLRYETLCTNKVHGFGGVIESPNFPNRYAHSSNCSWIIEAPMGNKVNLSFSHFDLEARQQESCSYDYLEISEGSDDVPNRELGKFCEQNKLPKQIHSSQHQVFLKFITDDYVAYNGFRLEWIVDGCGGHLVRPSGTFTSPGYPEAYSENVDCEWLIEVDHTYSIQITLNELNTERTKTCSYDKLQIYGGSNDQAPLMAELCYAEKPIVYTSPGNTLFVKFHSDSSFAGRGFMATYESVPIQCGGKFTAPNGVIHSANYPKNYPNLQNCEWLLQVDPMHVVNITFQDFDVEASRNCTDDYVKIFDGPTRDYRVIATHCRNDLPPSYVSSGHEMLVVMRTDGMISAKGFKATYRKACGARIVVKDQGYLSTATDFYPDENLNCTWILTTEDPADHVVWSFTHMDFQSYDSDASECLGHYVQAIEGEPEDGVSLGKWCNNRVPASIVSTGNTLTVHLFSEYYYSAGSFAATFHLLNSACGGNYTSEHGSIASPGYPNSYPLNIECVWILQTSPGNKISLTFADFDLQGSEDCNLDYLEIREENGIGNLIGTYCGQNVESVAASNQLWLKFKSDSSGTAKGFSAEYSFLHGNDLQGPTGVIASPLYPKPYRGEGTFYWRISVDFGFIISIKFTDFYIHGGYPDCSSYIKIYDGYNTDGQELTNELCGFVKPTSTVESSSNVMYIEMVSTYPLAVGNYFSLTWLQIPRESVENKNPIKLSECDEEVPLMNDNATYTFSSPGEPYGYEANLNCNWIFTSPPGTHLVLRILAMDLEETTSCFADSVSVYDGNAKWSPEDATLLGKMCLSNSTYSLVKASNVMTVKFESDSYLNKTGFRAIVYRECGGKLTGPNGEIEINSTASVRGIRTWRLNCEWHVQVRPGRTIEVKVTSMDIVKAEQDTCGDNYLLLKNGGEEFSPFLGVGKYCGNQALSTLSTTGNRLYVKATGNTPHVQFRLEYKEVSMNCGENYVFSSHKKTIEIGTPNYPNVPPPFSECSWSLMTAAGETVSIHFVERFDLTNSPDCEKEFVEIRDGGTESSRLLGRFCSDIAPSSVVSTGNMLYVRYYSEVAEPKNGFKAIVYSGKTCSGIMRSPTGTIHSPNYPNAYPKNEVCGWMISAPEGHSLKLQFRDLHLPGLRRCESTDHVTIAEKITESADNTTISELGTYCGSLARFSRDPLIIESASNEVFVTFTSDDRDSTIYRGFLLNYTASKEACGGELTAISGIIKTPGYPNPKLRNRYCDWRITVQEGTQVVVDILDMDVVSGPPNSRMRDVLSIYNDFGFKSKIISLGQEVNTEDLIMSSSNTMRIVYWSSRAHRGFKLQYYAWAPAPCGGRYSNIQGVLKGPSPGTYNQTSYICNWVIEAPEELASTVNETGLTLSVKVNGTIGIYPPRNRHCMRYSGVSLKGIGDICGRLTKPLHLRSPNRSNKVTILKSQYGGPMQFNVSYEWQRCGGILTGETHTIKAPKNLTYPISCAWDINYPDVEEVMTLSFKKLNIASCDKNYIIIRKGGPYSPQAGVFCGNIIPPNITSTRNRFWIEYYATADPNDFELNIDLASAGCGLTMRGGSREISSPNFPKQYPSNAECMWEINAENGYHVGLTFVDRFNLESSENCKNDFLQIFDWIPPKDNGEGTWNELGKVCGRISPPAFNSTTNRMKVLFRTNEAVDGDGFRALWWQNCGGVFQVTNQQQIIQSPGYPNYYGSDLFCNYTFIAPDKDILVEFTDFHLEGGQNCQFDNVSVKTEDAWNNIDENFWCGEDTPPIQRSISRLEVIFRTDRYMQKTGFQLKYFLTDCGGIISEPGTIEPLMHGAEYFGRMNCTWVIKAPTDKSVILRFEKFVTEFSSMCYFDSVVVYEGELIESEKMLGRVCGNLSQQLPVFKSVGNNMVVSFNSDDSRHYEGFRAEILFGTSQSAGCGGNIELPLQGSTLFKTQSGTYYESLEDCHWLVKVEAGQVIKFTINHMDLKCSNNGTMKNFQGDYIEIHDGAGPFSESLGKYCGSTIPGPILSTSNYLWIRLFTDGTVQATGVRGQLESMPSLCGPTIRGINDTKQIFTSPGYPNNYPAGTKCKWTLKHPDKYMRDRIHVRFIDFDTGESEKCEEEGLEIYDKDNHEYIGEGFGENFIYSGTRKIRTTVEGATYTPLSVYRYCGSLLPNDYYSNPYSTAVEIVFKGTNSGHKGFKLEYGTTSCDRNYTSEQGRIVHQSFTDCWITITAPANRTISLYFNHFSVYSKEDCTDSGMQIRDGDFNGNLLASLCGSTLPSPVFSNGNKLSLHSWSVRGYAYEYYDITYTTTDKGRGCGGRIFNYGGKFSSPMYPNGYRNDSECTWDVIVPRGFKVVIEFNVFDIGSGYCFNDYVKIYDVDEQSGQTLRTTLCPNDEPTRIESDSYRVNVVYKSSVNNGGSGWVIAFMAMPTGNSVELMDNW